MLGTTISRRNCRSVITLSKGHAAKGYWVLDSIFFDVDGVLLDTIDIKGEAFADTFDGCSQDQKIQILNLHRKNGGVRRSQKIALILDQVFKQHVSQAEVLRFTEIFAGLVIDRVLNAPEIPGASSALKSLSESIPLHAVSATPLTELEGIIEARGWKEYFCSIHSVPPSKGSTVHDLITRYGYARNKCIFIGDSPEDRKAAQENEVPFVLVSNEPAATDPYDLKTVPDLTLFSSFLRIAD